MTVIVGCPVKNDLRCLQLMLDSLVRSTKAYDKIIFVDGGSTDGSSEYLNYIAKIDDKIAVIHANTKTPLDAYNLLFDIALQNKTDLLLTQTDVIFPALYRRDWLKEMKEISGEELNIGAMTCINGGGISNAEYIDKFKWLGGWCTYLPFRTIERLGGYDVNFPNGYGVDIDYTYRILREGWSIGGVDYWVDHTQANTREHDRAANTEEKKKEAALYFRKKWKLGEFKE